MRGDRIVTLIGVFKLVKSALLVAVGVGVVSHPDVQHWASAIRIDPNNHYVHRALGLASDPRRLAELGVGTFLYAAVFAVEGVGLLLHRRWAEYFTIAVTASFIPLEVYETARHVTIARLIVLVVNAAIVVYLVARVLSRHSSLPSSSSLVGR
jgi:uncharacterized membrane protein (DUF2068 family)